MTFLHLCNFLSNLQLGAIGFNQRIFRKDRRLTFTNANIHLSLSISMCAFRLEHIDFMGKVCICFAGTPIAFRTSYVIRIKIFQRRTGYEQQ